MVNVVVYVILLTKLACERQTGEMLQPVPVNWVNIKPNDEGREQADVGQQRDSNEYTFPVLVKCPEGDVGKEGKGEQQAADEAKDVGDVINPWQQATQEEEEDDAQQFEKGLPRLLQHLPTLEQLNKEASKETKLRPCWTHLSSVGQEQGRGKVASDATENVYDRDACPTCQLLQVSQYGHLEHY